MFDLFGKATFTAPTVEIGAVYILKQTADDPFPPKANRPRATVIDVLSGWVRYKIGDGTMFSDERMKLDMFLRIYQKT